ncbi:hypothetical protein GY45DRAFT_970188 [Cubamyces sp. BRFM 1775]|nr:hypothetical protein GY45DRAFT_970188 [Cubamyces sp. BRFM 1775]
MACPVYFFITQAHVHSRPQGLERHDGDPVYAIQYLRRHSGSIAARYARSRCGQWPAHARRWRASDIPRQATRLLHSTPCVFAAWKADRSAVLAGSLSPHHKPVSLGRRLCSGSDSGSDWRLARVVTARMATCASCVRRTQRASVLCAIPGLLARSSQLSVVRVAAVKVEHMNVRKQFARTRVSDTRDTTFHSVPACAWTRVQPQRCHAGSSPLAYSGTVGRLCLGLCPRSRPIVVSP